MATTMTAAVDTLLGLIKTAWDANAGTAVGGSTPALVFEATEKDMIPHPSTLTAPWGRVAIRHGGSKQTSMGPVGRRRFERTGTLWVQCYIPWKEGADLSTAEALALVARNGYEGVSTDNVTLRAVALQERGRDGNFYRWDVLAQFTWYEIK